MHREEWGTINYGQRGPRGRNGRGVYSLTVDSEGMIWAEYTDRTKQPVGEIPKGEPGEPGKDGRIQDVIVNGQSVVDSEGVAYITTSEGAIYTAGENIEISPENVISAQIDDKVDEDILVTVDVGNYYAGDVIPAGTLLKDVVKNLLYKETPPTPPVVDSWFWWASNDPPTEIPGSASSKTIDAQEVAREGLVQYFTTNRQYATCAYPASMGNLTHIIESDFLDVLSAWTRVETIKDGVPYLIYYNVKTKSNNLKEEFKWR